MWPEWTQQTAPRWEKPRQARYRDTPDNHEAPARRRDLVQVVPPSSGTPTLAVEILAR